MARDSGKSSEIERGEVPELAALGNVLRELFNTLGISQRQYAHRIHLDPSAVSRYLSGQRRPGQQFVEQLIAAVEEERGSAVTPEAREAVRGAWLAALKACDPDEYRLEVLRDELARSRREAERANRNVEALQLLLEQKEAQVRDTADDLVRLRMDWSAERKALSTSQDALGREVEELRQDLLAARRLHREAEEHGRELRERVLRLEGELAERGASPEVPLEAFKGQLERTWEEEDSSQASRELTEAAWARSLEDVRQLAAWLVERGDERKIINFVTDVARLRPAEDVVRFARHSMAWNFGLVFDALAEGLASRVAPRNVAFYYCELVGVLRFGQSLGDEVLAAALRNVSTPDDAIELITRVTERVGSARHFHASTAVVARRRVDAGFPFIVAVALHEAGALDIAVDIIGKLSDRFLRGRTSARESRKFPQGVGRLDEQTLHKLFSLVATRPGERTAAEFAALIHRAAMEIGDLALSDQLLDTLGPEFEQFVADNRTGVSGRLYEYVTQRHANPH
ncbi:helix-turn-helix domain-containing protein [Streptomyces sp. NPDC002888]|uniref:helix-turn-helix domain-containing protein n=1 Tax=Streptomyces sp. NPDC002888 TaxID=3364668 RepID=UPI003683B7EE